MTDLLGYCVPQDLRMAGNALLGILLDARVKDSGVDPALSQSHADGSICKVRWYLGNDPYSQPAGWALSWQREVNWYFWPRERGSIVTSSALATSTPGSRSLKSGWTEVDRVPTTPRLFRQSDTLQ